MSVGRCRSQLQQLVEEEGGLGKTIAFLAECPGSASAEDQLAAFDPGDQVVTAGRHSFNKLEDLLAHNGMKLRAGDRIKVYDLSCLTLSTSTLIRLITRWLGNGVAFEIVSAGIAIEPRADDRLRAMLEALDGHYRYVHGIKTQQGDREKRGRKQLLEPGDLVAIRAKLDAPGATATDVARELGVARSTLFNFLDRYDVGRGSGRKKKTVERQADGSSNGAHVAEGEALVVAPEDGVGATHG